MTPSPYEQLSFYVSPHPALHRVGFGQKVTTTHLLSHCTQRAALEPFWVCIVDRGSRTEELERREPGDVVGTARVRVGGVGTVNCRNPCPS